MAVPKRKTSIQKKRSRRSHHAIGKPNVVVCPNCGYYTIPHRVCKNCGYYKGVLVLQKNMITREQRLIEKRQKQSSNA